MSEQLLIALIGLAGTILVALAGIVAVLISTRRKVSETNAATQVVLHTVNSRWDALERHVAELVAEIRRTGGVVPDMEPPPKPVHEIELAAGSMTVKGEATTVDGDVVQVEGVAAIQPDSDPG